MKDIPGYEGYYAATEDGKIWSYPNHNHNGIFLKQMKTIHGYATVRLCVLNKTLNKPVHRLIAKTFIKNPNNLPQVNHMDCNKLNNNVSNLEWVTASNNRIHKLKLHGFPKTEKFLSSVRKNARICQLKIRQLTNEQVLSLRKDVVGGMTYKIAKIKYGINESSICDIINSRTYKEIL